MALDGKKTYITAGILALASFATAVGWLNKQQYEIIAGLLGSLGLAALRIGVSNCDIKKNPGCGEAATPAPAPEPVPALETAAPAPVSEPIAAPPAALKPSTQTGSAPAAVPSEAIAAATPAPAPAETPKPTPAALAQAEPVAAPAAAASLPLTQQQFAVLVGLLQTLSTSANAGKAAGPAGASPLPGPASSRTQGAGIFALEAEAMPI